jgi:hypothetical protein
MVSERGFVTGPAGIEKQTPGSEVYSNRDFVSLRLVCKEIYVNTTYDAGIRYVWNLQRLDVDLTANSLALLLHVCSVTAFRDKIEVIHPRHTYFKTVWIITNCTSIPVAEGPKTYNLNLLPVEENKVISLKKRTAGRKHMCTHAEEKFKTSIGRCV